MCRSDRRSHRALGRRSAGAGRVQPDRQRVPARRNGGARPGVPRWHAPGTRRAVSVTNAGSIAAEMLPHIFDPFRGGQREPGATMVSGSASTSRSRSSTRTRAASRSNPAREPDRISRDGAAPVEPGAAGTGLIPGRRSANGLPRFRSAVEFYQEHRVHRRSRVEDAAERVDEATPFRASCRRPSEQLL